MAERQEPDLTPDELTERLVPDPSQPPDAVVLTGFLGRSAREGHVRLYLDATLTNYVEVPEEAILDRQQAGTEESPLGRSTTLWLRRGTQLEHTVTDSRQVQAEFLEGDITGGLVDAGIEAAPELPIATPWHELRGNLEAYLLPEAAPSARRCPNWWTLQLACREPTIRGRWCLQSFQRCIE